MTFEEMPAAIEAIQKQLSVILIELKEIRASQPINETPIDGAELRRRLNISRPTEIAIRNKGKLPFLMVSGQYSYQWQEVVKALQKYRSRSQ